MLGFPFAQGDVFWQAQGKQQGALLLKGIRWGCRGLKSPQNSGQGEAGAQGIPWVLWDGAGLGGQAAESRNTWGNIPLLSLLLRAGHLWG